jgi:hypothetical protein
MEQIDKAAPTAKHGASVHVIRVTTQREADVLRHMYVVKEILEIRQFNAMPKPGRVIDLQKLWDVIAICDELYKASAGQTGTAWCLRQLSELQATEDNPTKICAYDYFLAVVQRAQELFFVAN